MSECDFDEHGACRTHFWDDDGEVCGEGAGFATYEDYLRRYFPERAKDYRAGDELDIAADLAFGQSMSRLRIVKGEQG